MKRTLRTSTTLAALSLVAATAAALAPAAAADQSDCTLHPYSSTSGYAECPAGAGDFEFRVVAESGGIAGYRTVYGLWVHTSPDTATQSWVGCESAPKCALFNGRIEFR